MIKTFLNKEEIRFVYTHSKQNKTHTYSAITETNK